MQELKINFKDSLNLKVVWRAVLAVCVMLAFVGVWRNYPPESQAQSINVASLGIVKFSDGIACQKKKAGRVVKKKVKKVTKETFVNLTKYYKDKNKGRSLSSKQVKSVKAADLRCKRLGVVENLYVDLGLKKSCTSKSYSVTNRSCKGKDGYGYKTIKEALLAIGPGDRLILRGGNYNTPIKIAVSGLSNSALVITNQTNEAAIIQGLPQGILINANYITIEGLTFSGQSGAGSAGIQVNSGLGIDITNNLFSGIQGDGVVLAAGVKETLVSRNVFHHVGGTAISSVDHGGDVMQYNAIFQSGSGIRLGQLGGTYVAPSLVHHNIVVRNSGIGVGAALPNGPGDNSLVLNNTVVGNGASGLQIDGTGHSLIVKNNIILDNQIADLNQGNSANLNIDFNLFGAGQAVGLHAFESAYQLPLILSDGNSNSLIDVFDPLTGVSLASEAVVRVNSAVLQGFSLGADSVAINSGVDTGFNAADFVGAAANALVDLGALEYTGVSGSFVAGPGVLPSPSPSPIASPSSSPLPSPSASPAPSVDPSPSPSINPSFVGFNQPPPPNLSLPTSISESSEFLYTGINPVQTGVAPGTIEARRVAVIRGKVVDPSGAPIAGVIIKVLDHSEFGQTTSRIDGWYDMAVNGGGLLTMDYSMTGYLSVQRQVQSPWRDYAIADDVKLTMLDTAVTQIDLSTQNTMMAHEGTVVTDTDGTRQAAILVPTGTTANLVLPNGTTQPITNVSIRATEYTVGPDGPMAMPGTLPPTSGYTYALELSVDEAIAAGAKEVTFNQALPFYVDNFLNFPVGMIVPAGYYDRARGIWVPSDNGKIIKIVSISAGQAIISINPNNTPATSTELTTLGVTTAELLKLGAMYTVGKTLWRVPIKHFTPWDLNWPYGPPADATAPNQPPPKNDDQSNPEDPCLQAGSIIECENLVLRERIPIVGTPYTLNYSSERVRGRLSGRKLNIPLSGASIPTSLTRIDLKIEVAGRTISQTFSPQTNLSHLYVWDGLDALGRTVNGSTPANVRVGYAYNAVYMQPGTVGNAFAAFSGIPISGNAARNEIVIWQNNLVNVAMTEELHSGLGGWQLSAKATYETRYQTLFVDGKRRRSGPGLGEVVRTVAGNGQDAGVVAFSGDGGLATQAPLWATDVAVGPDSSIYFSDFYYHRVRRISPNGIISTIAGNGNYSYSGDGGLATLASLKGPQAVAVGPDGSVYVADRLDYRIRKIDPDGIISTVAGNGVGYVAIYSSDGDGGSAVQAKIQPWDLAVGADGSVYIVDKNYYQNFGTVRRVSPDGIINTVAGGGPNFNLWGTSGIPASQAMILPIGISVDIYGNILIGESSNRVSRVSPSGIITKLAGAQLCINGNCGNQNLPSGDGGPALLANLVGPRAVVNDGSGRIFIREGNKIRIISQSGIISNFAGGGVFSDLGLDFAPLRDAFLAHGYGLEIGPDGTSYFSALSRIKRITSSLPGFELGDEGVATRRGNSLFRFNSLGRHLDTREALTGAFSHQFGYDAQGLLNSITDVDGQVTTINHDANGNPTSIVAPFGQTTTFTVDANGYLASVTNPKNETYSFTYSPDGLMQSMVDPKGNAPHVFTYDADGRLLSDTEPASSGGAQSLSRVNLPGLSGFTAQRTTGLNRQTNYLVDNLSTGAVHRRITAPDGTFSDRIQGTDGSDHRVSPDGTIHDVLYGPDPRFQMQSPIAKTFSVTTPGNVILNGSSTRSATLATANDPFSLQTLTDTTTFNGKTYTQVFNKASGVFTYTSPANRLTTRTINSQGRTTQVTIPSFDSINMTYDSHGRIDTSSQGSGPFQRLTQFAYDSNTGYLQSVTDPLLRQLSYQYDAAGRVTQQTLPDNRVIQYGYDANGNLTSLTPPGRPGHVFTYTAIDQNADYIPPVVAGSSGNMTSYNYNLDRQLSSVTRPDGQQIVFNHNVTTGKLQTEVSPGGTKTYAYNATTGKLSSITGPYGENLAFTYDGMLPTQTTWSGPVAGSVQMTYNNDFRVSSLKVNDANAINFGYDNDGLLTSLGALTLTRNAQNGVLTGTSLGTSPNQVTDTFSYSTFAELSNYVASFGSSQIYSEQINNRDKLGRIVDRTEVVQGTTTVYHYDYDLAGRLYQVTLGGVLASTYTYDSNGNRLGANTTVATYDNQDRLLTYGNNTFTYTANGELLSKTTPADTTNYVYDVYGSLISVNSSSLDVDYVIDSAGRRVGKKLNNVMQKRWLYQDSLRPIAEFDGAGVLLSRFNYASKANVPDYMTKSGVTYRIISDHLGSVRLVVNMTNGAIAQRMDYDEFGIVTQDTNPGFQPFGFAGGLYDPDTKLVRFGARDYDSETGRWTSKDPIMFAGGDTNLYGYVLADPINKFDPLGLEDMSSAEFEDFINDMVAQKKRQTDRLETFYGECKSRDDFRALDVQNLINQLNRDIWALQNGQFDRLIKNTGGTSLNPSPLDVVPGKGAAAYNAATSLPPKPPY